MRRRRRQPRHGRQYPTLGLAALESQTFKQLQQIRTHYTFLDVDIDRYRFGDNYRQVLLLARELSRELPGKGVTWVNRRLQYTHGFGVVMSPATPTRHSDGQTVLLKKDLLPETPPGLSLDEAAIYYGEEDSGYRIVTTGVREFDYPRGDENVYTRYGGDGGVPLSSFWRRLLYAWLEFDVGISSPTTSGRSRIQFWRAVQERIGKLAPFLEARSRSLRRRQWGSPVLDPGRLHRRQRLPYAEPAEDGVSYIRNSVKVVIDAFNGDVAFYVIDPRDPVIRLYRAAFPHCFAISRSCRKACWPICATRSACSRSR